MEQFCVNIQCILIQYINVYRCMFGFVIVQKYNFISNHYDAEVSPILTVFLTTVLTTYLTTNTEAEFLVMIGKNV